MILGISGICLWLFLSPSSTLEKNPHLWTDTGWRVATNGLFSQAETSAKGPLWPDFFVKLESQSSKYQRVFLWLRFCAFLELGPYLAFCKGLNLVPPVADKCQAQKIILGIFGICQWLFLSPSSTLEKNPHLWIDTSRHLVQKPRGGWNCG
jgi:hypothetical protein